MIETTYIRLAQAAEMLGTDQDTLLIAAGERRIRLFGLVNKAFNAQELNEEDRGEWACNGEPKRIHFYFAHIQSWSAYDLLFGQPGEVVLVTEAGDGKLWLGAPEDNDNDLEEWRYISRDRVFLKRTDVESIKAAHATPAPDTIKDAPLPRSIPRDNSLIGTLAALLAAWPGGAIPSGKDLEKAAQLLGLTLSDDTIRKALKAAQEAAPSLPLPK